MEVKSFSAVAILIIVAAAFAGAFLANQATSYNTYNAAGQTTGSQKPKVNTPTMRRGRKAA